MSPFHRCRPPIRTQPVCRTTSSPRLWLGAQCGCPSASPAVQRERESVCVCVCARVNVRGGVGSGRERRETSKCVLAIDEARQGIARLLTVWSCSEKYSVPLFSSMKGASTNSTSFTVPASRRPIHKSIAPPFLSPPRRTCDSLYKLPSRSRNAWTCFRRDVSIPCRSTSPCSTKRVEEDEDDENEVAVATTAAAAESEAEAVRVESSPSALLAPSTLLPPPLPKPW